MMNVTSEELFGEMTDNNIAEALQRIPGISANSDGGSEIPRYVNIRGFDGSLNSVQLNGSRLPTSGTGQGTVYGDTVGGIVNLITKSAFDRGGRSIEFSAGADYIALREKFVPNFTFGYSDLLSQGRTVSAWTWATSRATRASTTSTMTRCHSFLSSSSTSTSTFPRAGLRSFRMRTANTTPMSSSATATGCRRRSTTS
jgi:hypothetical protein